jgi:hypothetical protein
MGEDLGGQEIEQVPIQPGRLHEAGQEGLLSLDVSELIGEVVTLHGALFTEVATSSKIAKTDNSSRRPVAERRAGAQSIL